MYDAIVVGARVGGAPTAMLLARQGAKVLLVDKAVFPSDTCSTHFLRQSGVRQLKQWGLLDALEATRPAPVERIQFDVNGTVLTGAPPRVEGLTCEYAPRRYYLDKVLLDAAAASGVEVREGYTVRGLMRDGDRVTGIRGSGRNTQDEERARIVIGADGRHSLVAREVGARSYFEQPGRGFVTYAYYDMVQATMLEMWLKHERCVTALPTHDGQTLIIVQWPSSMLEEVKGDLQGHYVAAVDLVAPSLAERMRAGRQATKLQGIADLPGYFRKPYGDGWALVGDAGYLKDPFTGLGMSDAFHGAQLLTTALHSAWAGEQPYAEAMAGYEKARNDHAGPLYALTCRLSTLDDLRPSTLACMAEVGKTQEQTDVLFGFLSGTVELEDLVEFEDVTNLIVESMEELPGGLLEEVE
jgi:2-polyprenyl-6-methoxyphenol hydroxylase-like FAD-dependent oxidoreductase